jgi:gluconolactonase
MAWRSDRRASSTFATTVPSAPSDQYTTNIAFGGADMQFAWITCSLKGLLVKTRWPEPGMRLVYNA